MSRDNSGSGSSSAAPSPSRQPQASKSEADFLARQASDAGKAMRRTISQLGDDLKELVDPRALAGDYPWASLAVAAVIGFAAASAITPSRKESFEDRLRSLFPRTPPSETTTTVAEAPVKEKPSGAWSMLGPVAGAMKDALIAAVSSAISAKASQAQSPPTEFQTEGGGYSYAGPPASYGGQSAEPVYDAQAAPQAPQV